MGDRAAAGQDQQPTQPPTQLLDLPCDALRVVYGACTPQARRALWGSCRVLGRAVQDGVIRVVRVERLDGALLQQQLRKGMGGTLAQLQPVRLRLLVGGVGVEEGGEAGTSSATNVRARELQLQGNSEWGELHAFLRPASLSGLFPLLSTLHLELPPSPQPPAPAPVQLLEPLARLSTLSTLHLSAPRGGVDSSALGPLGSISSLRALSLPASPPCALQQLTRLTGLTSLSFAGGTSDAPGLSAVLASCTCLRHLQCCSPPAAEVTCWASPSLSHLHLGRASLRDLSHLMAAHMPALTSVCIGPPRSAAGVIRGGGLILDDMESEECAAAVAALLKQGLLAGKSARPLPLDFSQTLLTVSSNSVCSADAFTSEGEGDGKSTPACWVQRALAPLAAAGCTQQLRVLILCRVDLRAPGGMAGLGSLIQGGQLQELRLVRCPLARHSLVEAVSALAGVQGREVLLQLVDSKEATDAAEAGILAACLAAVSQPQFIRIAVCSVLRSDDCQCALGGCPDASGAQGLMARWQAVERALLGEVAFL